MLRLITILMFSFIYLNAQENSSASLIKQKIEIKELKKELSTFYNKKEKEYQKRKKELDEILAKIEKEKKEIEAIEEKNREILENIKGAVSNKTTKIYNKMKAKIAAGIFNQMINEGKVEDVFDIILQLKESKVTAIMRYLSPKNASMLTQMLHDFRIKNKG